MANLNQRQYENMNAQGAAANIPDGQAQGNLLFEVGPPNHVAHRRPRFIREDGVQRPRYTSAQKETALRLLNQGFSHRQVAQATSPNCSHANTYRWQHEAAEARRRNRRNRRRMIVNCGHFLLKLVGMFVVCYLVCYLVLNYPVAFFRFVVFCINVVLGIMNWQ